jgi:hypothetical protein
VCIDDDFVEPYSAKRVKEYRRAFSKDMYESLTNKCECAVTIVQYKKKDSSNMKASINQKDLFVIDWNLGADDVSRPLQLIDYALQSNVSFICIYTNEEDTISIRNSLLYYFSGIGKKDVEATTKAFEACGLTIEDEIMKLTHDCFATEKTNLLKLINYYNDHASSPDSSDFNSKGNSDWKKIYIACNNICVPTKGSKYVLEKKNCGEDVVKIGGTFIFTFSKSEKDGKGVTADKLIATIAQKFSDSPNPILGAAWLYWANKFGEILESKGSFFANVSDKAFAKYLQEVNRTDKEVFDDTVKDIFKKKMQQCMDHVEVSLPEEIKRDILSIEVMNTNSFTNDLGELNELLNTNSGLTNVCHKLYFGDVFVSDDDKYWMCITAKCDCARPDIKIENEYTFIQGTTANIGTAMDYAEKGNYSFLRDKNRNIVAVEWKLKLHTVYVYNTIVGPGKKVVAKFVKGKRTISYICNICDSYAQRMANAAFAEAYRVGVSYATTIGTTKYNVAPSGYEGPYDIETLIKMAEDDILTPETSVLKCERERWKEAKELDELSCAFEISG